MYNLQHDAKQSRQNRPRERQHRMSAQEVEEHVLYFKDFFVTSLRRSSAVELSRSEGEPFGRALTTPPDRRRAVMVDNYDNHEVNCDDDDDDPDDTNTGDTKKKETVISQNKGDYLNGTLSGSTKGRAVSADEDETEDRSDSSETSESTDIEHHHVYNETISLTEQRKVSNDIVWMERPSVEDMFSHWSAGSSNRRAVVGDYIVHHDDDHDDSADTTTRKKQTTERSICNFDNSCSSDIETRDNTPWPQQPPCHEDFRRSWT